MLGTLFNVLYVSNYSMIILCALKRFYKWIPKKPIVKGFDIFNPIETDPKPQRLRTGYSNANVTGSKSWIPYNMLNVGTTKRRHFEAGQCSKYTY